jgi:protein-disulfide isomerase
MAKTTQTITLIYALIAFGMLSSRTAYANDALADQPGQNDVASSQVVATVGSGKITLGQAEQAQPDQVDGARAKLLAARMGLFMAERTAALAAIDNQLLAAEAAKEHISTDELLKRHVDDQIKVPSEEALNVYYLGAQTQMPYAQARPKIIDQIHKLRRKKVLDDYLASLRKGSDAKVTLLPPHVEVAAGNSPVIGPAHAPVTLIEFADYQCPYCHEMEPVVESIREQYGDRVRFVYKNFPLPNHQYAEKAAEAALCAGQQGQYWPYHDRLFATAKPEELQVPGLKQIAADLKLDTAKFGSCLDSGAEAATVTQTFNEGRAIGLSGTPTFTINGYILSGAIPQEVLTDVIDIELAKSSRAAMNDNSGSRPKMAGARAPDATREAAAGARGSGGSNS